MTLFFSVENATTWITPLGFQLYLLQDDTVVSTSLYNPEDASTKELRAYRSCMVGDDFLGHTFFSLENTAAWINPGAFQAYMTDNQDSVAQHGYRNTDSTSLSSWATSQAASSIYRPGSRASSRASFVPSSRASSPFSWAASDAGSRPPIAMSDTFNELGNDELHESNTVQLPRSVRSPSVEVSITTVERPVSPSLSISGNIVFPAPVPMRKGKGKGKAKMKADPQITITRELKVDEIVDLSIVPSTFPVPRRPTALRIDLSKDQDSWKGSSGSLKGDVTVFGFDPDPTKGFKSRRCHLYCNGVKTCQYFDETIFSGCERYEPDEDGMRELWDRELEANKTEAALPLGVLAWFYARVVNSKCKIKCDGVPIFFKLKDTMKYGKRLCVGCSNWSIHEKLLHRYEFIPQNVYENTFEYVFHNNGRLPHGTAASINESCILTVHPRIALPNCHYTHIIDDCICVGKIQSRPCPTEMLIYIPVEGEYTSRKALVVLRNAHNHPMHPQSKPTTEDRTKLGAAVEAVGLTGLTVQKLLNAPATSTIYKGKQVAETSPAFANKRKVRDFITEKKDQHPRGMGWDGVLHELSLRRAWTIRRGIIDAEFAQLRKGELAGVRIQGRRPDERPSNNESVASASESNSHVDDSDNKDMASVEASNESLDPYSAIPSVLRDDHQGPVPMDANINVSTDLDAYPATLLMDSSATAHDFLTDAELGLHFEMDDIFANIDPYFYDFGATTSTDPNNLPLLRMPSASPPPRPATPDALPDPDVPLKAGKKRRNPSVDPPNMIEGTRRRNKSRRALGEDM
ncbi:hypothetical protein B0H13DRAFT_2273700 [Mycena leptocephala]|nr:hypothetical protein B0H13DRAFT_2273700 [Mycena leptocephala]